MSKHKFLLGAGLAIFALLLIGIGIFSQRKKEENLVNPLPQPPQTNNKPLASGKEPLFYEDEAGFSFKYPQSLGMVEKDVNDKNTYSSLELSSKNYPGQELKIKITDTSFTGVDKWLEKNSQGLNLISSSEISFGGMKGKILKYSNPDKNLVLVINKGILYFLEAPVDKGFWDQSLTTIVSSFQLTDKQTSTSSSDGSSSTVVDEGEEVVE